MSLFLDRFKDRPYEAFLSIDRPRIRFEWAFGSLVNFLTLESTETTPHWPTSCFYPSTPFSHPWR